MVCRLLVQRWGKERGGVVLLRQYPLFASSADTREPLYIFKRPGKICSEKKFFDPPVSVDYVTGVQDLYSKALSHIKQVLST